MQRNLAPFLLSLIVASTLPGRLAVASVGQPEISAIQATTQPPTGKGMALHKVDRVISSYAESSQGAGQVLASLRPVRRDTSINFDEAALILNNTTLNERIFNKDFTGKMPRRVPRPREALRRKG